MVAAAASYDRGMSARAGIIVTGTEVLTGRVPDANGPWLAEQLRGLGVDVGRTVVVGDRPDDLAAALRFLAADHDLVITSGGLGPTADDLTADVVADVQGRPQRLDEELHRRVGEIVDRLVRLRGWSGPTEDFESGTRKQSRVPEGAHWLAPVGTAPGLVVPARESGPPVLVLPGPPGELRPMWDDAVADPLVAAALAGRAELHQATIRLWGPPEAELAALLREHEAGAPGALDDLEVTTCLRDGELEMVTRYSPGALPAYAALKLAVRERFGDAVFSTDGATIDEVLAGELRTAGATVATAESCTAGLLAGRLADLPGSSDYLLGGFVTYANRTKVDQLGVRADLLERCGAVSEEVAAAMAAGARERLGASIGVGVTGVAGPTGGTPDKPVGLVHVCASTAGGQLSRRLHLPGSRAHVRGRTVVTCLHLVRELLGRRRAGP